MTQFRYPEDTQTIEYESEVFKIKVQVAGKRILIFSPQPQSWGPIEFGCPSVCHRFLVRAKTFEREVIETWLL